MLLYNLTDNQLNELPVRLPHDDEIVWIRMQGETPEALTHTLEMFGCHPLLIEDCVKLNQRPKLDTYSNNMYITFFAFRSKELVPEEIGIIIGPNYVITVHKEPIPFLDEVYAQIGKREDRLMHPGDVLYSILDRCVDEYSDSVNRIEEQVERMERAIYRNPYVRVAQDIFRLKRQLHQIRRIITDEKAIVSTITHQSLPYTRPEKNVYFVDVYDHISRVVDSIDIFREALSGLLELQMNMKSDRMNEIMKTLTIISSIFLPLTFVVGLYGMNFRYMPELDWPFGYGYVWILMIALAVGMIVFYKLKRWW